MTSQKKPRRPYDSTGRQAQARETRRRIVEAARGVFAERGYAGATIDAIAQAAGVAPETVFAAFGNKRGILAGLVEVSVGGDDLPIPLLERPGPQSVMEEADPVRQMRMFSHDISEILERVAPVFEILRIAAKTEPEIAELLRELLEGRWRNLAVFVKHLRLRKGIGHEQATEMVWTLTSPEVFRLLTADRGWTRERYAAWLEATLSRLLLP
jgi:AcrR family transcriptional regulator